MDPVALMIGLANAGTALLLIVLMLPLLGEKIPRNQWYGFRFPTSLASDRAWYAVNRYGARLMLRWAVALLVFGMATLLIPLQNSPVAAVIAGSAALVLLIPAFQAWRFSRQFRADGSRRVSGMEVDDRDMSG